jgi:hypothetical protein
MFRAGRMGERSDTGHLTEKPEKITSFAAHPPMKRQEGAAAYYRTRDVRWVGRPGRGAFVTAQAGQSA